MPPVSYLVLGDEAVATFAVRNVSGVSAYSPRLNVHINAPGATVVPTAPAGWTCGSVIPTGPVDPRVVFWRCGFDGEYVAGSDDEITFTIAPPTSMPVSLRASTFTLNPDSNPVNNAATAAFTVILVP